MERRTEWKLVPTPAAAMSAAKSGHAMALMSQKQVKMSTPRMAIDWRSSVRGGMRSSNDQKQRDLR